MSERHIIKLNNGDEVHTKDGERYTVILDELRHIVDSVPPLPEKDERRRIVDALERIATALETMGYTYTTTPIWPEPRPQIWIEDAGSTAGGYWGHWQVIRNV